MNGFIKDEPEARFEPISLTIPQFCKRHNVSKPTVHRWIKNKRLGSIKVGHLRRITLEHEREFLERHSSPGA